MKTKKMPIAKAAPSKAGKHAPPPMTKPATDVAKRPMETTKKPKSIRMRKI